jgi:hypothetical protein
MENLILNSLEIRGFRCFRHLQIEHLGRVNLIVGKNNIGKTSLLEALQLYAYEGHPTRIWELLRARDESTYNSYGRPSRDADDKGPLPYLYASYLKYLFNGRKDIRNSRDIRAIFEPILIGPAHSPNEMLSIAVDWYAREEDESGLPKYRLLQPQEDDTIDNPVLRFTIQLGKQQRNFPLPPRPSSSLDLRRRDVNCVFITANGLDRELIRIFWEGIALTELEDDVLTALRIITPGVERLSFISDLDSRERVIGSSGRERVSIATAERFPIPIGRVTGIDEPIPLRSLGDGMQRVLGISLALINATDGMLLIDEFENGLHYSIQPDLWHLIFRLAQRLNVQVFATTHSWDCIEGFQKAAQENEQVEGLLISLENRKAGIAAVLFNEEELGIVTRERIEVR